MADNRKYYYLKLKEDFFDTDEMKILESMKDGYLYSNILLKLYLKSLSNSGRLMYRNVIPYTPEILATLTGHQVGTVEKALDVFKKLDLIEMLDNGAIYMMDIQNFIGQSSSEADRQREYYNRMKAEKEALAGESTETPELPEPKEPVLPAEQKSNKAIGNYTTDFEELWEAYPRKVDKGQAYKKYKARLEDGFSHEQLYEAVKNYAAQCKNGYDNAGYHNSVFRGKYLGTSVTAEQHAQIAAGTFKDLYIGDYWTINGVNWRIAHFDYWLRTGDTECTKHHIVVVPDTNLYTARMNATNVTTGGYFGSEMKTTNLAQAETIVKAAFGVDKILTVRRLFVNAVANGKPSNGSWYDSTVDLMTEGMAYGANWFTPACDGSTVPYLYTTDFKQLALFALAPSFICNRNWYWLQNVVSAAYFADVDGSGTADYLNASFVRGVRPASAII